MKKIKEALLIVLAIVAVTGVVTGFVWLKFHIYKKKYGDHMTFTDFMFDSSK